MIKPRSKEQLDLMRQSGKISALALKRCLEAVKPGVNLLEIEKIAWKTIKENGGEISFTTVGDYKWATCLTVNEQLVHGIPHDYVLKKGDLLSIDVGAVFKGWHTDCAWSVVVGEPVKRVKSQESRVKEKVENEIATPAARNDDLKERQKFLAVGEEALWKAIKKAVGGNYIGDISNQIQTTVEGAGFNVSRELIGHGVGEEVHEPPDVPGVGKPGMGLQLQAGMTIAIEAIYAKGNAKVYLEDDGWTYTTIDHSWGGVV